MRLPYAAQCRYLAVLMAFWLLVFFLTRCALTVTCLQQAHIGLNETARIVSLGLLHDLRFLAYASLPLHVLILIASGLWPRHWRESAARFLTATILFIMLYVAVSEWLFWAEFDSRFNFIAVDYLIYSHEVVNNILESYPVYPLLALLALISVAGALLLHHLLDPALRNRVAPLRQTWPLLAGHFALAGLLFCCASGNGPQNSNAWQRELTYNGPFQFFVAFCHNELDYEQFYATLPATEIGAALRAELTEPNVRFVHDDPLDIRRLVDNPGQFRPLNIVLVMVESLSARYLNNAANLTPNLDRLRPQSLFFNNFYATGTRTDRGLEAITLSIPPTPGRSIVKRLGRESGYASLGQQLAAVGYDCVFLYGGRGYFDNMNAFFSGNGYRIVDQSSVPEKDITFKNAWGMCDEDLYAQVLRQADADAAAGRHFLLQVMTTSNHRPFTYPDGRIDIPSGSGRDGAVRYTDFALGRLLDQARNKPWFGQTLFVVVADHTASSAGKDDLPVDKYRIPLFVYGPGLVPVEEVSTLASQIDLAPTLLGLLHLDYESTFFGRNVLGPDALPSRALIGNYQYLGLFDGRDLAILGPRQTIRRHDEALGLGGETKARSADPLIRRDIAYYQGASYALKNGLLRWPFHPAPQTVSQIDPKEIP